MHQIVMLKMGQTMEEGTVVRWLKREGDRVEAGEPVVEVETDKVKIDIQADASGYLTKILVDEGQTVPILAPLALIGSHDEDRG